MRKSDIVAVALVWSVLAVIVAAGLSGDNVNDRWVKWQECVQTRSGGDASLQWCDKTFKNPALSER